MVLTHLLDTSVITRMGAPDVADRVGGLLGSRRLGCTSVTMLEVGFSARSAAEHESLMGHLAVCEYVAIRDDDLRHALTLQRLLAANGLRGRKIPDLLVAAAAQRLGLIVLHYDRDFEWIAKVSGQRHEWVVPAGSVD